MDELARLLDEGLGDGRMSVAERGDRDAGAQIEVTPARDVIEIAAGPVTQHDLEAPVSGHHVLLKQGLHGSHVVAHDRWR